jgi:hypothetical protein
MSDRRTLRDLESVGPATVRDLALLGITTVRALAREEPRDLYERLCAATGARQDPCVLDVFCAAVAQARAPDLPAPMRRWWFWSRIRKLSGPRRGGARPARAARARG